MKSGLIIMMLTVFVGCVPPVKTNEIPPVNKIEQVKTRSLSRIAHEVSPQGTVHRVLSFGDYMSKALWNDPSVIKINEHYVMYATANVGGQWGTVLPFRGTSKDGIHWVMNPRPLLALGQSGSFDEDSVETPSIVHFKGQYHMFYTGIVKGLIRQKMAIGHAISNDGIVWRRVSKTPLIKPTGNFFRDWNGFHVAEPGAVVFKNRLYVYFHASGRRDGGGSPGNQSAIGYIVSDDGVTFSPMKKILTQGPLYPSDAPEQFLGYSTPSAVVVNNKVHLFYDVIANKPSWQQVALHHAVSTDGINFIEDEQSLLKRDDVSWTKTEIRAPSALYEDGRFKIWFGGHDIQNLKESGIGYIEWIGK